MLDNYRGGNLSFITEFLVRLMEEGLWNGHQFLQILCHRVSGFGVMLTEGVYGRKHKDVREISSRIKDFVASAPS
jgi:hypothetical protein